MYKLALVLLAVALQHTTSSAGAPINITSLVKPVSGTHPELSFDASNVSTKNVTAYVVVVHCLDDSGKSMYSGIEVQMSDPVSGRGQLLPGDTAHLKFKIPVDTKQTNQLFNNPADFQVFTDYVEFADGTHWGPDTMHSSIRVQSMRAGIEAARSKPSSH